MKNYKANVWFMNDSGERLCRQHEGEAKDDFTALEKLTTVAVKQLHDEGINMDFTMPSGFYHDYTELI